MVYKSIPDPNLYYQGGSIESMEEVKFQSDASPAMLDLLAFVRENTGLLGDDTIGTARFHVGANTMEIISHRRDFDSQDVLLWFIEDDERFRIKRIGVQSMLGGRKRPSIIVEEQ